MDTAILRELERNDGACLYWQMSDQNAVRLAMDAGELQMDGDLVVHPAAIEIEAGAAYTLPHIYKLASDARPIDDHDYGTERQITAENKFFDELESYLTGECADEFVALQTLRATTDELIDNGLALLEKQNRFDAEKIAAAFNVMAQAAWELNEIYGRNDHLNESVPSNMPLPMSADEFAAECNGMSDHYEAIARGK